MTDAQKIIEKFLDELYAPEIEAASAETNDPYVQGWGEAVKYLQAKSYANLYALARKDAVTFDHLTK